MTVLVLPWWWSLLAVLGAAGFLLALYFTLVTYGLLRPDAPWLPQVCRMDEGTCARIVHTPQARVLGLPNSVFGMAYYLLVIAVGLGVLYAPLYLAFYAGAAGSALLSAYLAWALLRKLRVVCVLCFAAHAINWSIAAFVVLAWLRVL